MKIILKIDSEYTPPIDDESVVKKNELTITCDKVENKRLDKIIGKIFEVFSNEFGGLTSK